MRILAIIFVSGLWLGCSGAPSKMATHWRPSPTGTAVYTVRLNPPVSLADSPQLSVEIECGDGWERIALEAPDEVPGAVDALFKKLETHPQHSIRVMGTLLGRTVPWGEGHHSRVLSS